MMQLLGMIADVGVGVVLSEIETFRFTGHFMLRRRISVALHGDAHYY
jgi:hypothetical protein